MEFVGEPTTETKTENIATVEEPARRTETEETVSKGTLYTITAYCPCVKCCGKSDGITATGTKATEGRTIAVDPNKIPYGTEVKIEGVGVRIAEDCGGAIKGNKIDLYFDSHEKALEFGRQTKQVIILN